MSAKEIARQDQPLIVGIAVAVDLTAKSTGHRSNTHAPYLTSVSGTALLAKSKLNGFGFITT